jgi:hypothetical protein
MSYNVFWLRADGQLNTVYFARLIVTTVMGRNFSNTVNKTQYEKERIN